MQVILQLFETNNTNLQLNFQSNFKRDPSNISVKMFNIEETIEILGQLTSYLQNQDLLNQKNIQNFKIHPQLLELENLHQNFEIVEKDKLEWFRQESKDLKLKIKDLQD